MPIATKDDIEREICERNFNKYFRRSWHVIEPNTPFVDNWHIDCIGEHLMAVTYGQIKRLIINIAPRLGKSRQITTAWPTWEWIHKPENRYLFSSYSGDLARDHSRERRVIIESDWYQDKWGDRYKLKGDQNVVTYFANDKGGRQQSRGTGGAGTGKGGNRIIIDDPHNVKQAASKVQREQAIFDYDKNLSTRLDNPNTGAIILVMQRLAYNDLTGHLLREIGGYEILKLPTVAKRKTIVIFPISGKEHIREEGNILFEKRQGEKYIEEQKRALGTAGYEAQHEQEPLMEGGDRIKIDWFGRFPFIPHEYLRCVQSWDTGLKPKDTAAPSVCMTFIQTEKEGPWLLVHVFRKQVGYPELKKQVIQQANNWKPEAILIEDKASGIQLLQEFKGHLPVLPIEPEADKITRMETQSPHIEAGQVHIPDEAKWLQDFETEVMQFPECETWDQIDTLSQFLKWAYGRKRKVTVRKLQGL